MKTVVIPMNDPYEDKRLCGFCKKEIKKGEREFYFHHEDEHGFCSMKCYGEFYRDDEEVMLELWRTNYGEEDV